MDTAADADGTDGDRARRRRGTTPVRSSPSTSRADPARVAELAPAGFTPRDDGSCTVFFCDWASAADRDPRVKDDPAKGQYKEAYIVLNGTFDGRPFGRVPFIWVDSELSLLRGQIQGFPKKFGQIHMTRPIEHREGRVAQGVRASGSPPTSRASVGGS